MKLNRRVTIITRFSGIMFSLLLLGGLAACSDDNNGNDTPEPEPSTYPTTPFSKNRTQRSDRERCATGYCHPHLPTTVQAG